MKIRASRISTSIALAITEDCRHEHLPGHVPGDAASASQHGNDDHDLEQAETERVAPPHQQDQQQEQEAPDTTTPLLLRDGNRRHSKRTNSNSLRSLVAAFFAFFRLHLTRYRPAAFQALRGETWLVDEGEYLASFPTPVTRRRRRRQRTLRDAGEDGGESGGQQVVADDDDGLLVPVGDLGYSGSTFFRTRNGKFLVKSLPRRFEHRFFTHDLLDPYVAHSRAYPASLLVRITDMPYTATPSLGGILGTAPTHHIVMENLLFGKGAAGEEEGGKQWETYDLKPDGYFFPERDIADGHLAPQSVKDRLVDTFPGKVVVSLDDRERLLTTLNHDTQLLAAHAAVDYSLFLVRYPQPSSSTSAPPSLASGVPCPWREGVNDVSGEWTYRAVVLDFFWAKSALRAKAMTGLVDTYNVVADQGPMSITAEPGEYRTRFMKMVDDLVVSETDSTRLQAADEEAEE